MALATFATGCATGTDSATPSTEPAASTDESAASTAEPAAAEPTPTLDAPPVNTPTVVPARFTPEPPDASGDELRTVLINGEDAPASTRFISIDEAISAGVEAGVWSQYDGVVAALSYIVGDSDLADAVAFDQASSNDFSGVIDLADELLDSGTLEIEETDRLRSLRRRAMPPIDVLEQLAEPADVEVGPPSIQGFRAAPAQASDACIELEESNYDDFNVGVNCYAVKEYRSADAASGGYTFRVFYPLKIKGTPAEATIDLILEAMKLTAATIDPWGDIGDIDVAISLPGAGSREKNLGAANDRGTNCAISVYPTNAGSSIDDFRQLIAHETVHCIQFENGIEGADWIVEGGAEYFSHFIVPGGTLSVENASEFNSNSLRKPLQSLSYDTWVWWQYLANRTTPEAVWALHEKLTGGADLAAEPNMAGIFNEFVILWSGPGFSDSAGGTLPYAVPQFWRTPVITGDDRIELPGQPFVARRWRAIFEEDKRFTLERQDDEVAEVAWVEPDKRNNRGAWTETINEVRSECDKKVTRIVVATSTDGPHKTSYVAEPEAAPCDPCVLDTWKVDLQSFEALMSSLGEIPDGSVTFAGDYFVKFDEAGWTSWRNANTITIASEGIQFVITISSIEAGNWTADGKRFTILNPVTIDSLATTNVGGLPITVTPTTGTAGAFSFTLEGGDEPDIVAGPYTCDEDELVTTFDVYPVPLRLLRVDGAPQPPTKIER
jgi:hypothetical protein